MTAESSVELRKDSVARSFYGYMGACGAPYGVSTGGPSKWGLGNGIQTCVPISGMGDRGIKRDSHYAESAGHSLGPGASRLI